MSRRTTHRLTACISHGDPDLGAEVELEIVFTCSPGRPASMYGPAPHPEEYAELDFVSCVPLVNGKPRPPCHSFADMEQASLDAIAADYLESDDGSTQAWEVIASDDEAAREYAAESRADR